MKSNLFWVGSASPGRVAIMPRPRGGDWLEDEVLGWKRADVDIVVSLLTLEEVSELELVEEEILCQRNDIEFLYCPIDDRGVPASQADFSETISSLAERLAEGKSIAIHCRQGIGRAALVAACLLIWSGCEANAAIEAVGSARGIAVPETSEQKAWILEFPRKSLKPLAR